MEEKWSVIDDFCITQGAEHRPTYGVRCSYAGGVWTWPDVDVDAAVVQVLVDRLNAVQPEPCHFAEMVLDFIEECAAPDL